MQARMQQQASDDLDSNSIARSVLTGIQHEDFKSTSVDALMGMVQEGHVELFGDVLAFLAQNQHPDWAAELCRMVMAGPDGAATHEGKSAADRDFATVASATAHMAGQSMVCAAKVCQYILELKSLPNGENYFDNYDVSMVLGHMVEGQSSGAAGQVLYAIYCDDTETGRIYQTMVPYVLGTLLDQGRQQWAVEISKQLMYEDGLSDRSIDYTVLGWAMAQMVYCGRADWAAAICDGIKAQRLQWYNQNAMLNAIASWGDRSYSQTVFNFMQGSVPSNGHGLTSPTSPRQGYRNGHGPRSLGSPSQVPGADAEGLARGVAGLSVGTPAAPATPIAAAAAPPAAATPTAIEASPAVADAPAGAPATPTSAAATPAPATPEPSARPVAKLAAEAAAFVPAGLKTPPTPSA